MPAMVGCNLCIFPALGLGVVVAAVAGRALAGDTPGTYANYKFAVPSGASATDMEVEHVWTAMPGPSAKAGNAVFASTQYWTTLNVGGYVSDGKCGSYILCWLGGRLGGSVTRMRGWGWGSGEGDPGETCTAVFAAQLGLATGGNFHGGRCFELPILPVQDA